MNTNPQKQNRARQLTAVLAALASNTISRIRRAKLTQVKLFGEVKHSVHYRSLCPNGAGVGPSSHKMSDIPNVGAKKFFRKAAQLRRDYNYLGWKADNS